MNSINNRNLEWSKIRRIYALQYEQLSIMWLWPIHRKLCIISELRCDFFKWKRACFPLKSLLEPTQWLSFLRFLHWCIAMGTSQCFWARAIVKSTTEKLFARHLHWRFRKLMKALLSRRWSSIHIRGTLYNVQYIMRVYDCMYIEFFCETIEYVYSIGFVISLL